MAEYSGESHAPRSAAHPHHVPPSFAIVLLVRLRITYHRPQDLTADFEQQFQRGGVLVRVEPPADTQLFSAAELTIRSPFGSFVLEAQVIQIMPGAGVALGFDPKTAPELTNAVRQARAAGVAQGPPPDHEAVDEDETEEPRVAALARAAAAARAAEADSAADQQPMDLHTRVRSASQHEKIQIALHGKRDERALIIRDPTAKPLHPYVLKNPQLQLDEVASIAGLRSVAPETLKLIASRTEWSRRPDIASALVRNPKTPVQIAIQLVPFVPQNDLRQIAKSSSLRAPIVKAVRKKVLS